jgi:DNA-binding XRE family transcriptional regulator
MSTLRCQPLVAYNFCVKGIELKEWRENHSVTQERLADALHVARNTIYRWEADQRAIPPYLERALRDIERELAVGASEPK